MDLRKPLGAEDITDTLRRLASPRFLVTLWACVVSVILLRPQLRAGYGLGHDMVFTPQQPLNAAAVGVSSVAPRAVPVDALVALLEHPLNGAIVGRLALFVPLLLAGVGTAELLASTGLAARLAASTFAIWNPFVVERLAIGQWALLWAFGALPWVVRAAQRVRVGRAGALALVLPVAAGSITPTGGVVCGVVALTLTAHRHWRWSVDVGVVLVLQLPWLVAALVSTGDTAGGAAVFGARGEGWAATVFAVVAGGGGIWNADVVPASRTGFASLLLLVLVFAVAALGWRPLGAHVAARNRLAWLALLGAALAIGLSVPGLRTVLTGVIDHVPGGGLLRDSQKWAMVLVLLEALLLGAAADRVSVWAVRGWRPVVAVAAIVIPVALLSDAAATLRPTLTPVQYPHGWATVAAAIGTDRDVAVVPFQAYRAFTWMGRRVALDPAPRLLPGTTVVSDALLARGRLVAGSDRRATAVGAALRAGPPELASRLAGLGVGWVVVELQTPGEVPDLTGLTRVYADTGLRLYRVPGAIRAVAPAAGRIAAGVIALAAWLALVLIALARLLLQSRVRLVKSRDAAEKEHRKWAR